MSVSRASQSASKTRLPDRPMLAICGPASKASQAMGRPVSLPAVVNAPGCQRTGCQASRAVAGAVCASALVDEMVVRAVGVMVMAGEVNTACPALVSNTPLSKLLFALTAVDAAAFGGAVAGVHLKATGLRVASCQAPLPSAGSWALSLSCLSTPCQLGALDAGAFLRPASIANCSA